MERLLKTIIPAILLFWYLPTYPKRGEMVQKQYLDYSYRAAGHKQQ